MDITSNKLKNKRYHTVGTVPRSSRKSRNNTLSEQFHNLTENQEISHCCNSFKTYQKNNRYHTVGTVPKSNSKTRDITLSEQFQDLAENQEITHCRNSSTI